MRSPAATKALRGSAGRAMRRLFPALLTLAAALAAAFLLLPLVALFARVSPGTRSSHRASSRL